jgi:hypothetical protein
LEGLNVDRGSDDGINDGVDAGTREETTAGAREGLTLRLGITLAFNNGDDDDPPDGVAVSGDDEGTIEDLADGTTVGIPDDGVLLGLLPPPRAHCPHDDDPDDTRVPVVELYDPVMPVIDTSDPVTALTPPPDTHATVPAAVVASPSQLPCDPEAVLL